MVEFPAKPGRRAQSRRVFIVWACHTYTHTSMYSKCTKKFTRVDCGRRSRCVLQYSAWPGFRAAASLPDFNKNKTLSEEDEEEEEESVASYSFGSP
jgi:hypothetical protein